MHAQYTGSSRQDPIPSAGTDSVQHVFFLCHDLLFLCSPASASISLTTHQDSHGPRAVCRAGITHLSSTRAFTPVHTQRLVQSYTVKTITASSSVAGKIHCTDSNEAESSLGDHTALCVYVTPSGQGGSCFCCQ